MERISAVLLVTTILCLGFAQAGFLDWFRSSANKGHQICKVDFEVLSPKGLRLWTAHKAPLKMFGIELYINPSSARDARLVCSVCKNTTDVVHGKFFIEDENVIVKKGDVLEYVAITDNGKTIQRHKVKKIVVNDYIIKPQGRCACSSPTPLSTVHEPNPNNEIELLERIISNLSSRCAEGQVSNYLYLQVDSPQGPSDLREHVKAYFMANAALKPYVNSITTAQEYADGISFQTKTIVDKLKILEISQNINDIQDFDAFSNIDEIHVRMSE